MVQGAYWFMGLESPKEQEMYESKRSYHIKVNDSMAYISEKTWDLVHHEDRKVNQSVFDDKVCVLPSKSFI